MNIFITGGSSGLGKAVVERLAGDDKHSVYFTYNHHIEDAEVLVGRYANVEALKCDFTSAEQVAALAGDLADFDLDVIVNNAYVGMPQGKHFHKTSPEEFLISFQHNLIPLIRLTQAAIVGFKQKKSGKIINILTSALLNLPPVGYAVYAANKAYLQQLSKSWNSEYCRYNITSNCISPDFMQTRLSEGVDERVVEQMKSIHPLHALLTPEEVAETVAYLVHASSQVNGINVPVNAAQNILK